jgi:hypothetical protein
MSHHPFKREGRKSNNEGALGVGGMERHGIFFGGGDSNFERDRSLFRR